MCWFYTKNCTFYHTTDKLFSVTTPPPLETFAPYRPQGGGAGNTPGTCHCCQCILGYARRWLWKAAAICLLGTTRERTQENLFNNTLQSVFLVLVPFLIHCHWLHSGISSGADLVIFRLLSIYSWNRWHILGTMATGCDVWSMKWRVPYHGYTKEDLEWGCAKDCQAHKLNREDAMEEAGKGWLMIRIGVTGWLFLLVPAHPGSPGQRAVKRLLLLYLGTWYPVLCLAHHCGKMVLSVTKNLVWIWWKIFANSTFSNELFLMHSTALLSVSFSNCRPLRGCFLIPRFLQLDVFQNTEQQNSYLWHVSEAS